MKKTKTALLHSIIALLVCISMLIGTTFAWFSDKITSGKNVITAGNLDLEMYWTDDLDSGEWHNVEEDGHNTIFNYDNWEPGYTNVKYIKLVNAGKLALNYKLSLTPENGIGKLAEVINVYYAEGGVDVKQRSDLQNLKAIGLLHNVLNGGATADGTLLAADQYSPLHPSGEVIMTVALNMLTTAGNEYQNENSGKFTITALASQAPFEEDSFGKDYDANAEYPVMLKGDSAVAPVTPVNGKVPAGGVTLSGSNISAFIPEGTEMEAGANKLTLKVTPLERTTSDIIVVNNEILIPVDVHIDGVAKSNTVPIIVNLGEILPKYLNMGNYHLYHVENGTNSVMQLVADASALTEHNTFTYNPLTGAVSVAMASFSEVTAVADTAAKWEGKRDYTWYNANATELTIANADQFAGLSAIVGGMDDQIQDSFSGKTIKLLSDINLNHGTVLPDEQDTTTIIFYPVGYYNSEGTYDRTGTKIASGFQTFEGTFDGAGHTISNIYQNTWEMKGDHDWYEPEDQYYRDGMGLFGKVYGGTIKNLTVDNFKSDGEITTTGVIASYADFGATFENIAITNCNPRVYNIGNGGIVGCVGWYTKDATDKVVTFKNITIDNSNMISALWGSYDVACGGIVGQYYPTSGQTSAGSPKNAGIHFENCHVAAVMDVYNDVCANYQYYAYRYAGMMVGSIRENLPADEKGHIYPNMNGITASGCTVHYDSWNDYYYCELVANSLASYTHDYQFSRLKEVKAIEDKKITYLDGKTGTVPTNGRYNYVVVDYTKGHGTENAKCYHFVDGKVWNHDDAGDETVNGVEVLKEDKQHIYLPFAQLFTGYGWGVTSRGIGDYPGIDITERDSTDLIDKFKKNNALSGNFLYRVGNGNAFPIGKLFQEVAGLSNDDAIVDSGVHISIDSLVDGVKFDGTFKNNKDDWTQSTLHITGGTGPAKLTIQDYNNCKEFELIVEVVDATNLTGARGTTTGENFVLLCDVNTTNYVNYWNCTLYGNGFTYSLNGAPTAYNSKQGHGILITKNATLDNLVIVGDVYNSYGAYTNQDYYNAAVDVLGDTIIQNCYISGCAAPVSTRANTTITNTTLYGGTVGNLVIKSGAVTLENVTTANYDDGRSLVGMGIVVHSDATKATKLVLNGALTQYNFVSEAKKPSDSNAQQLYNAMFADKCAIYHFGTSPNRYVNAGIISMSDNFNGANIVDNANTGYTGLSTTVNGVDGYVYTQPNTSGSVNNNYNQSSDSHVSTTQGPVAPEYSFDHSKNYVEETDGSNEFCYEDNGTVLISTDEGDSFQWETSILNVSKLGKTLSYTVSMNGVDYTGKSIVFNTAGDYTVIYTYTDSNNYKFNEKGEIVTYSKTYTKSVNITVNLVKAAWKDAEIKVDQTAMSGIYVMSGDYDYSYKMKFLDCITITDYDVAGNGSTVNLAQNIKSTSFVDKNGANPGKFDANSGTVTITYNDGKILTVSIGAWSGSGPSTKTCSVKTDDGVYLITDGASNAANTGVTWKITGYTYTGNNGKLVSDNVSITFTWDTNSEGYNNQSSGGCFTPDTLITLADGSQKRVDELNANDKILAWDFFTGTYVEKEISLLVDHGEKLYKVANLKFSDDSMLRIIAEHGIFDYDLNEFVYITVDNMNEYIGHRFVKHAADGSYDLVTLIDAYKTEEYTSAWSVSSAETSNAFASGLLTVAPPEDFYNWIEMAGKLHYDVEQFQKDIATYGLYTYDDFKDYVTCEQFIEWNGAYLKVAVEKGHFTFEYILELIEMYKGWMP